MAKLTRQEEAEKDDGIKIGAMASQEHTATKRQSATHQEATVDRGNMASDRPETRTGVDQNTACKYNEKR